MNWKTTALVALTLFMLTAPCQDCEAKLRVVTSTEDLASITRAVAFDEIDVAFIAKGFQDPHYVEPKPSYMKKLNKADGLFFVGLQLEIGWLPLLIQGARNPKIAPGSVGLLDLSNGIELLEVHVGEIHRGMGDVHPEGNPHYWLNPGNGIIIAHTIAEWLVTQDPEHSERFQQNLDDYKASLASRVSDWEKRLTFLRGAKVVAYHKNWEYLADWLGFEVTAYVEDKPGIPPTPRHVAELEDHISSSGIKILIYSDFVNPSIPERIAERTGVTALRLPASVGSREGITEYIDLFESIVSEFEKVVVK